MYQSTCTGQRKQGRVDFLRIVILQVEDREPLDQVEAIAELPGVEAAVADALAEYSQDATIAVIPKGPYVIAELA